MRSRFDRSFEASPQAIASWTAWSELGEAASARAIGTRTLLSVGGAEDPSNEAVVACEDATRSGDGRSIINTTMMIGHVYFAMRRYDHARVSFERSLLIARTLGDRIGEGAMLDAVASRTVA